MSKTRILYVSQAIQPFLPESDISRAARQIPQGIHERGREIRVFMPRFGVINERRHQLHEVIRLSGMNLNINDTDHPLIIKVASIPTARMQVYFIDNEHYFKKKVTWLDAKDKLVGDNDERAIFFARGVLETVRKLSWAPDIIHCHGWMASLVPLYLKELFKDDAHFENTKIVTSLYGEGFDGTLNGSLHEKISFDGIGDDANGDGVYGSNGDDAATTPQLKAGEFALLSAGPDRRITRDARVDNEEFNRDNIVEIGP